MAYIDNNSTAWGKILISIGTPDVGNKMSKTLSSLGIVKEGSLSFDTEEGTTREWKEIGGTVIDSFKENGKLTIKCTVKNINKALASKVWGVTEVGDKLEVHSFTNASKFSVKIEPNVVGAEVLEIPYSTLSAILVYSEDSGYDMEITITVLKGAVDVPLFFTSKKA